MPRVREFRRRRRIRDLVACAVASAPTAPTIDEPTLEETAMLHPTAQPPTTQPPSDRTRRIVGGLAGLGVIAVVISLIFVTRPDDQTVQAPGTTITPAPTSVAPTSMAHTSMAPTSTAPSQPVAPPVGAAPSTIPPDPAPTTEAPPVTDQLTDQATDSEHASVVAALADGFEARLDDGTVETVVGYPASIALRVSDGRIFFQRRGTDAPGIFVTDPATEVAGVPLPGPIVGSVLLHDAAVVDGEVVLLIEESPQVCQGFGGCDSSLWAFRPDTGAIELLSTMSTWEAAWTQLNLASNGLVVGTVSNAASVAPYSVVLPGAGASPIDPATFGLEATYFDCEACPTLFTIDGAARHLAWVERDDDGATIVVSAIDGARTARVPLTGDDVADCCRTPEGGILLIGAVLEIADVSIDPATNAVAGRAVVNIDLGDRGITPLLVDLSTATTTAGPTDSRITFGA